jgi:hypothetical protein
MCQPKTKRAIGLVAAVAAAGLGAGLAGCSDMYLDRRDTIGLSAGDAVAANEITQMVDPWPPASANKNIAFNGQKMQTAVERYRTDRIIHPVPPMTSDNPAAAAAPAPPPVASASPTASSTTSSEQ